jgi:aryl-alcohol dehydrogenase-like predicted oxidoreductase
MGVCPWSPLASGLLTGKYNREGAGEGRLAASRGSPNPVFDKFSERNFGVVDALLAVSKEIGRSPAQVAINWITRRPGVSSTLIGATKIAQLEDNLAALEFEIPAELSKKLDEVGRPETHFPYIFFGAGMQGMQTGGVPVRAEPRWFRAR